MTSTPVRPLWSGRAVALLAIVALALSIRSAVAAVSPILDYIGRDIELSSLGVGAIGSLPPVVFAVSGLIAPPISRRLGLEGSLVVAIIAMIVGHLVRAIASDFAVLMLGSAIVLVGMGIANVLLPPAVKRYFPDRIGLLTATYATLMSISTALPALLAAPLADSAGWRFSLGVWSAIAVVALVPWLGLLARHRSAVADDVPEVAVPLAVVRLWRSRTAVAIMLSLAVSSIGAYSAFAWLPEILRDVAGVTPVVAGSLLALFSFGGLPASIIAPILVARLRNAGILIYVGVAFFAAGYLGLLLAPSTFTWLWVVLIGLGPVLFPVSLVLINLRTRTHAGSVALSGFSQGLGYTLGALGPLTVGLLHDATNGWTLPIILLIATTIPALYSARVLGKPSFVEDELAARSH